MRTIQDVSIQKEMVKTKELRVQEKGYSFQRTDNAKYLPCTFASWGRSRKITPDEESHFKGWGMEKKDKGLHLASAINPTKQRQCWNESHLSCSTMRK